MPNTEASISLRQSDSLFQGSVGSRLSAQVRIQIGSLLFPFSTLYVFFMNSDDRMFEKKFVTKNGSISIGYDPYFNRFEYFSRKSFDRDLTRDQNDLLGRTG